MNRTLWVCSNEQAYMYSESPPAGSPREEIQAWYSALVAQNGGKPVLYTQPLCKQDNLTDLGICTRPKGHLGIHIAGTHKEKFASYWYS